MATTVASFSAIDDTAIDAESPIVESMMKQMRDNSYWIDAGTRKTTQTSTTKVLTPDGSGGVSWVEVGGIAGVDGTKGTLTTIVLDTTWTTLTALTKGILQMHFYAPNSTATAFYEGTITIDLSDDTFQTMSTIETIGGSATITTGTITTGQTVTAMYSGTVLVNFEMRRDSGNLQYRSSSLSAGRMNLSWVIL